ncbi:8-amino-7-oxononanoate synthase [Arenicella chitinivorans]|uniref:8-amino-7-oxononanoate synthase n=1 Tax=Arenicella chitinivorans TaxID=1329800 RepID=A0A918RQC4_9GAMM|nr:8-amino-7-oxononanoate synthase [Arenicella chitinivorans]GHA06105.1 8-amino-7-oxononanoate synthase [Arenicella chitinivorans]
MFSNWSDFVIGQRQERDAAGLWRERRELTSPQSVSCVVGGRDLINFSSNDYLGLANNPALKQVTASAVTRWGVGAGASHLVCGHQSPHENLEADIASLVGAERTLLFSTGYMANLGVVSALLARGDVILQDKLNHASIIDAGVLSSATSLRYAHGDANHARKRLATFTSRRQRCMLVSDTIFSMDGDVAPVVDLKRLADEVGALLVLDDAHGFGVCGERGAGTLESLGLNPRDNVLMIGTLGKAVGGFGAFVAGDADLIAHIEQFARSYVYTTAVPAYVAETNRAAVKVIAGTRGDHLRARLDSNITLFRQLAKLHGLTLGASRSAIQPIQVGCEHQVVKISQRLEHMGFWVVAIRPPTVPKGTARLRVSLCASHTDSQIEALVQALATTLHEVLNV